jgi:hypothetical protein
MHNAERRGARSIYECVTTHELRHHETVKSLSC